MRTKAKTQGKFMHYVEKPKKLLHKAKDFYVKSMEDCSNMISHSTVVAGASMAPVSCLPMSFSLSYSNSRNKKLFREVLAAVSKNKMKNERDLNYVKERELSQQKLENGAMQRSYTSVGLGKIGTIDEDKPCYFEDDMINARSRSFAVMRNFVY